ncbi:MAG TPA: class I SAM-dependent methyltransferase [Polyangiaceae bacterium]|nr:class I SAM-dependent methyltransferase [Polyangiaceae bacterium]
MSDWTSGYVADIGYTYGYYSALNPVRARLPFLNAGLALPVMRTACELGFGQGMSVNLHAAASATEWHGTDFNPSHAAFAQELAGASGSGAALHDAAFAEFCARPDLPDFDYIGLHGIWSWVSDENRGIIVDFIRRKLRVGGVLYVSYNTLPGWAAMLPVRHLMAEHAEVMAAPGRGTASRVDAALEFIEKLFATNPKYAQMNPGMGDRLDLIKGQSRSYLAHEYFNRDWMPMPFSTMAEWLSAGKVEYACSATHNDHIDNLNLTKEQQALLRDVPDPGFRESVRDLMVNRAFRSDYWVKGARRLSTLDQGEALRAERVQLIHDPGDVALKTKGALGEVGLSEAVYRPLLDILRDFTPRTIGALEQSVRHRDITFAQLAQAMLILVGKGDLAVVQSEETTARARPSTDRLNRNLILRARGSTDVNHVASPVTGGGIGMNRMEQLFLLALLDGKKEPLEWARFGWATLYAQGQRVIADGKRLETAEQNLQHLAVEAAEFAKKRLPSLRALGVV